VRHALRVIGGNFALAALAAALSAAPMGASPLRLVPLPKRVVRLGGETKLDGSWRIHLVSDSPEAVGVPDLSNDVRIAFGWSWSVGRTQRHQLVIVRQGPPPGG